MDLTPTREDVILLGLDAYERRCRADLARAQAEHDWARAALIGALGAYLEAWKFYVLDVVSRTIAQLYPIFSEVGAPYRFTPPTCAIEFAVSIDSVSSDQPVVRVDTPKWCDTDREPWAAICGFPQDLGTRILTGAHTPYVIRFDVFLYVPVTLDLDPTPEIAALRARACALLSTWQVACAEHAAAHLPLELAALTAARADLETQFSAAVLSTLKVLQCPTP